MEEGGGLWGGPVGNMGVGAAGGGRRVGVGGGDGAGVAGGERCAGTRAAAVVEGAGKVGIGWGMGWGSGRCGCFSF